MSKTMSTHASGSKDDDVPPEMLAAAKEIAFNSLPNISKRKYTIVYNEFKKWRSTKNTNSFAEAVLLVYFNEIGSKFAASTLWSKYSMLKATIKAYDGIDISKYPQLIGFLKKKNSGYKPKKSKVLTTADVSKFLEEAPDAEYLGMKALLVIGLSGACRREELTNLCTEDVQDHGTFLSITLQKTKTKITRTFTVVGEFYTIIKKYMERRPNNSKTNRFFLKYRAGRCVLQPLGINKIGSVPQEIAKYLKLENPELYTGHTFRRSSATILVDAGGDITDLKRHGGWKSNTVAEGYIEESISNKKAIGHRIESAIPSRSMSSKRLKLDGNIITESIVNNEETNMSRENNTDENNINILNVEQNENSDLLKNMDINVTDLDNLKNV